MECQGWKEKLDLYLDGELPDGDTRDLDSHLRSCSSCSADALQRVQMKRAVRLTGQQFLPSAEFRKRIQESIALKPRRNFSLQWALAAVAVLAVAAAFSTIHFQNRSLQRHIFSEIADSHVATLASSSPVDVLSTDRHTVKPWFQGRIPFAFNLPEVQNTDFTLLGGSVAYLDQAPGAHLIYDLRKHHISVFIFREQSLPAGLGTKAPTEMNFSMDTWAQNGLRYFVIGDANSADIDRLAALFKNE